MVNDTIADFLTRIRNAQQRKKELIELPSTKLIESMCVIMKKEGFIQDFEVEKGEVQDTLRVELRYINGVPAIRDLVRVSKPGIRKYRGYKDIKNVKSGMGVSIYSTPKGVITGENAVKEKVGGEFICYIY